MVKANRRDVKALRGRRRKGFVAGPTSTNVLRPWVHEPNTTGPYSRPIRNDALLVAKEADVERAAWRGGTIAFRWVLNSENLAHHGAEWTGKSRGLSFLEALAIKLQRSAVFRDSADNILGSARLHVSFNFKGDLDLRIEQAGKMLNHGSGYRINVSRQPSRIQCR